MAKQGLRIVALFGKETKDGHGRLAGHVKRRRVRYPVLYDAKGENVGALGIKRYPSAFVLDARGKVVWEGVFTKSNHARIRKAIRPLLKSAPRKPPRRAERKRKRKKL